MSETGSNNKVIIYPSWHSAISGGVAGFGSRMITAPLDLIRIRRQLNTVTYPSESLYRTWINIINNEGGIKALYKGNLAAIYLWVGYAAVQFSIYNNTKEYLQTTTTLHNNPTTIAFISGAIAGLCATMSTYPFDLCRTTFVVSGTTTNNTNNTATITNPPQPKDPAKLPFSSLCEPGNPPLVNTSSRLEAATTKTTTTTIQTNNNNPPRTFIEFTKRLYITKGIRGFYVGALPATIQIIPYMGLNFAIYDWLNKHSKSVTVSAYAGSISGAISKIIVYPIDTIKRRLQAQAFYISIHEKEYTSIIHCIQRIYQEEGITTFYRGMVPSVLKTAISTSLSFAFFTWTKNTLANIHDYNNNNNKTQQQRIRS